MPFPTSFDYVVIGAGIHGLSTACHLALELKKKPETSARTILVLDKSGIGAGASGIAYGVIRNNYYQPAMRELVAHSVETWEEDAEGYGYNPVGYMQISPESMHADVAQIYESQKSIGYPSEFIEGEKQCLEYMRKNVFEDWQAKNVTSILHEKKGGYAHNTKSLYRLAEKAEGVRIMTGAAVVGLAIDVGCVTAVRTDQGDIACGCVVAAPGPWAKTFWDMLELPETIEFKDLRGQIHKDVKMWTYWCLEEGTLGLAPEVGMSNVGKLPPVIHLDSDAPLYSSEDGSLITDEMWGIYYKPDFHFAGIQGGSTPYIVDKEKGDLRD